MKLIYGIMFGAILLGLVLANAILPQSLAPSNTSQGTDSTWLQVVTIEDPRGMDAEKTPDRTVIITTARPTVRQTAPKRWQITFTP